jgi:succinate dehydrogenase/fumarate reductase-like Fe-S protein
MEEIIMDVDEEGNCVITVNGVKGKACAALTKDLEEALGTKISDTKTREYDEVQHVRSDNRLRG